MGFWDRKSTIKEGELGYTISFVLPKKEFEIMFEILKDAEKYDFIQNIEVRDSLLCRLQAEINKLL